MKTHETKTLKRVGGRSIEIDLKMVDLIQALWNFGVDTTYCCEGTGKVSAYIAFETLDDWQHAYDLLDAARSFGWEWLVVETCPGRRSFVVYFPTKDIDRALAAVQASQERPQP